MLLAGLALTAAGCSGRDARPTLHRVVITRFQFQPPVLEIASGDTVEWSNQDLVPHTATATDGRWDSNSIAPDTAWRFVPVGKGLMAYGCRFHPNMKARLVVR